MAKNVKIYTTPTCTYCKMTKDFLEEHNIPFQAIDVVADAAARAEMIDRSGQMGVPVIDIDGELMVGFDKEKLSAKLGIA